MYIQFKIFKTVEELNEWLKQFQYNKVGDRQMLIGTIDGQRLQLMDITWLPCGDVSGDDSQINGNLGHYAAVKYGVWNDAHNQ